ncbi:MAG: PfkB family carbohydrate kinase, partial [Deinococcus sp.]
MILVVGSANIDFVTPVEHIPAPGETVLGSGYTVAPGGKGANQAVACGRAGGKVAFVGALGRDPFAELLRESLRESGVEDHTLELDAPTGAAFISVSAAGENAITVASGANGALTPELLPAFGEFSHLVMQLELPLPTVLEAARRARAAGARVVLNASPARALPAELLRLADVLVVNEGELSVLDG